MRTPRPVPGHLAKRAFSRAEALEAGLTARQLDHPRFVQVFPAVYRLQSVELDPLQMIDAARLALPGQAVLSHQSRFALLGLEPSPSEPIRFTIARDHHLDIEGIKLHRTTVLPPNDGAAVSVEAAFIQCCSVLSPIDCIAIGDWLLHREHTTGEAIAGLAVTQRWRPGASLALRSIRWLDGRSASLPESRTRVILVAAGIPVPDVNADINENGTFLGRGDLVFWLWRLIVEYEGRQHAVDTRQFARDIERYGGLRGAGWEYIQVTHEHLVRPRVLVARVHQKLVERGYRGPDPRFGTSFRRLFVTPRLAGGMTT